MKKYNTRLEATRAWVNEFNAIPINVFNKLIERDPDDLFEVTPPSVGDSVYVSGFDTGEIIGTFVRDGDTIYEVRLCDTTVVELMQDEFSVDFCGETLPMWGTMWSFTDPTDQEWLDGYLGNHIQEMANCGFRIYAQEDFGYVFGIDGAGYDFYESHWIPLYIARGLKWSEEDEQNDNH